jgi:surface polysaccharide O-acyltransferase-like enzyme
MQAAIPPGTSSAYSRLYFLDWVRILAFFVLIAYHVGMYYVSWGWHVKSPHAGAGPEPFMMLSSPWRLTLLFFVAGAASHFLLGRLRPGAFVRRRSLRLLVPLLFGMLVIVPPQPYLEVVEKLGYADGFAAFMRLYLSGYGGFCQDGCLALPTWNHLWFVAYLWVYTLVLAGCAALLGDVRIEALARWIANTLNGWKLILVPALLLGIVRVLLLDRFPQDHSLTGDWYNHATYLPAFLLGALAARTPRVWQAMQAQRWIAFGLALAAWAAIIVWFSVPHDKLTPQAMTGWRMAMRLVYTLCAWSAIVAACGFARRHLDRDGPARRYLTDAVFPVYIAHQTLIVVLAHAFKPLNLAPGLEALLLMVLTATGSFALYEAVRRLPLLRPLFGLAQHPRQRGAVAPAHAQAPAPTPVPGPADTPART